MPYPRAEYREAYLTAKSDGVPRLGLLDHYQYNVPILERHGYLPRDFARVRAEVAKVTEQARASLAAAGVQQAIDRQREVSAARRIRSAQRAAFRRVTGGTIEACPGREGQMA